jgi:hypothetical protein
MSFIISSIFIAILAFSAFCFYAGISSIGGKIKKDGLYSAIEIAIVIFLVTALVVIAVGKVNALLLPAQQSHYMVQEHRV